MGKTIHYAQWDWNSGVVNYPGAEPVVLTRQQADILEILWRKPPPEPARKEAIITQLYGLSTEPEASGAIVKVQAGHIRRKLKGAGIPIGIEGVRGVGYALRFDSGITSSAEAAEIKIGMNLLLGDMIEAMERVSDPVLLSDIFSRAVADLGFCYTGYQLPRVAGMEGLNPVFIADIPSAWSSYYLEAGYIECDPLIAAAQTAISPFVWATDIRSYEHLNLTPRAVEFIEEAHRHGIRGGVTVPIVEPSGTLGQVNFFLPDSRDTTLRRASRNRPLVTLLANYYHKRASAALMKLSLSQAGKWLSNDELTFLKLRASGVTVFEANECMGYPQVPANTSELPNGSEQCEFSACGGKRLPVCAAICDSARAKLEAKSCTQAIIKAMSAGLLKLSAALITCGTLMNAEIASELHAATESEPLWPILQAISKVSPTSSASFHLGFSPHL